jgi:phosphoribosylformimino-5-aminoimidazole carboxamide ribotide isomerase
MLIIPLIRIESGLSTMHIKAEEDSRKLATKDPVKIATIFRGENFKTIHVSVLDTADQAQKSVDVLKDLIKSVDIPIQISGPFNTPEEIEQLFKMGCYRVVKMFRHLDDLMLIKTLLKEFSASKIVVKINTSEDNVYDCKWENVLPFGEIPLGLRMKEMGVKRLVYSNFFDVKMKFSFDYGRVQKFADHVKIKLTVMGGIKGRLDLKSLLPFESYGLDSVVIGRPLYENKFCCESLWRLNEKYLDDLGPTRRI